VLLKLKFTEIENFSRNLYVYLKLASRTVLWQRNSKVSNQWQMYKNLTYSGDL